MSSRCHKKFRVLIVLALLYVCTQGCHATSSLGDQEMKGYSFSIEVYDDSGNIGNVPKLIKDVAIHEEFSELPKKENCTFFYKNDPLSRLEPIQIFCCRINKTSPELPDFRVAVFSWRAESPAVRAQIDTVGQSVYELIRDHGAKKMTASKGRIGYH